MSVARHLPLPFSPCRLAFPLLSFLHSPPSRSWFWVVVATSLSTTRNQQATKGVGAAEPQPLPHQVRRVAARVQRPQTRPPAAAPPASKIRKRIAKRRATSSTNTTVLRAPPARRIALNPCWTRHPLVWIRPWRTSTATSLRFLNRVATAWGPAKANSMPTPHASKAAAPCVVTLVATALRMPAIAAGRAAINSVKPNANTTPRAPNAVVTLTATSSARAPNLAIRATFRTVVARRFLKAVDDEAHQVVRACVLQAMAGHRLRASSAFWSRTSRCVARADQHYPRGPLLFRLPRAPTKHRSKGPHRRFVCERSCSSNPPT